MIIKTMRAGKFKEILRNEFAKAVDEKKYKRVSYGSWKTTMEWDDNAHIEIEVELELSVEKDSPVIFRILKDSSYTGTLTSADNSLGSFLKDYFLEEENKNMSTYTTTTTAVPSYTQTVNTIPKSYFENITINTKDYVKVGDITKGTIAADDGNFKELHAETLYVKDIKMDSDTKNINEEKKMKGFNFDFGPVDGNKIHMSVYGMAIKNAEGSWVSYDTNTGDIIDVDIMNFNAGKFMYKMPVAIKDITVGDVVIHNKVPTFVTAIKKDGLSVIDIYAGEKKLIIPTKNMFGFNFVTKVISMFNACGMGTPNATQDQPFGNMLPLLMMGDNKDIDPMMLMLMMNGGQMDMSNPMMMYFMMGDKNNDMLPLMLMMNQNNHKCNCNCGERAE